MKKLLKAGYGQCLSSRESRLIKGGNNEERRTVCVRCGPMHYMCIAEPKGYSCFDNGMLMMVCGNYTTLQTTFIECPTN
jgi:hypothetical protein